MSDSYERYSRVVENYIRYRPRYPHSIIDLLQAECELSPDSIIADIGSGTGLLSQVLLKNGNPVFAVEPNQEMREAARDLLAEYQTLTSVDGTAEASNLASDSVDMITVAQAFHWFDRETCRPEFLRILKPGGYLVLVWNLFRADGSDFMKDFEAFWLDYVNPGEMFHSRQRPAYVDEFYKAVPVQEIGLDNFQVCDFDAFQGRILSASRAVKEDDERYPQMLEALKSLFDKHQVDARVTIPYDTQVIYGKLLD